RATRAHPCCLARQATSHGSIPPAPPTTTKGRSARTARSPASSPTVRQVSSPAKIAGLVSTSGSATRSSNMSSNMYEQTFAHLPLYHCSEENCQRPESGIENVEACSVAHFLLAISILETI